MTSKEGENWAVTYSKTNSSIYDRTDYIYKIIYANGKFVAVGGNNSSVNSEKTAWVMSSPDGTNWTTHVSGPGLALYGGTYAQNRFVAVGDGGVSMISTNASDWETSTPGDYDYTSQWQNVVYYGGRFIALANTGYRNDPSNAFSSTNGQQWQLAGTITDYGAMRALVASDGNLLTSGESGKTFVSSDGSNWSPLQLPVTSDINDAESINNTTFLLGASGFILSRTNEEPWKIFPPRIDAFIPLASAYDGKTFVTLGYDGRIASSPDGQLWSLTTNVAHADVYSAAYAEDKFVAVGSDQSILISSNGQSWQKVYSNPGAYHVLEDVAWNGSLFVAVGWQGYTLTSTNAIDWESHQPTNGYFYSVTFGNGLFVASMGVVIVTSTDGVNWTARTNTSGLIMDRGVYGHGKFVLVGDLGRAWVSANGVDWVPTVVADGLHLSTIITAGDYFLTAGDRGLISSSKNGLDWQPHLLPSPNQIFALAYGHDRVIAAGTDATFLRSDPLTGPLSTIRSIFLIGRNRLRLSLLGLPGGTFEIQHANRLQQWSSVGFLAAPLGRSTFEQDLQNSVEFFRASPTP